jgi:hypothetical protein
MALSARVVTCRRLMCSVVVVVSPVEKNGTAQAPVVALAALFAGSPDLVLL